MFHDTTLGEMLEFYNGKAIKPGGEGRFPAFGSNGLIGGSDEYRFDEGIVIGRVGAYCGSVVYCPGKFWASDNTIVAKPKEKQGSTRFFAYLLRAMNLNRHAGGAAQPLVTQGTLKAVPATVPAVAEQHRIASILSAYDDLIENNTRRIAILEEMARRIYEEWFVRFRFPGHEDVRMVESELGLVPEGWSREVLADCAHVTMGQSPSSEFYNDDGDGLPFHQGVTNFGTHYPSHKQYCSVEGRLAQDGDILVSVRAPVGRINLSPSKLVIGRGLCAVRSKAGKQVFLLHRLLETFKEEDSMGNGAIFKAVSKQEVLSLPFLQPKGDLADRFEKTTAPLWELIRNLSAKNVNLRTTRDLLLPKLVSGELDVSAIPEPKAAAA